MKRAKSPLRWSSFSPRAAGFYWYRQSDQQEASIVKVYWDGEEWSLQYDDLDIDPTHEEAKVDWCKNWGTWAHPHAQWSLIPEPRED